MSAGRLEEFEVRFMDGVAGVPAEAWDRLLAPGDSPFVEWAYLAACEAASATREHAALPRHATLWQAGRLVAALLLYVKADGRGEFVYDDDWRRHAGSLGVRYYPKLVSMAPFTPVVGSRCLVAPEVARAPALLALARAAESLAAERGLSGVHYLLVPEAEADVLSDDGRLRRLASHLVLENPGFRDFGDYLARFRSRDRTKIRRQRARLAEQGLRPVAVMDDEIVEEHFEAMYDFYAATCERYGTGSQYLQRGTWERLFETWRRRLVLFFAARGPRLVGGALAVAKDGVLYGRYWGARGSWRDLHFNVALYQPIEFLIERGWRRFDVGWGNTYAKFARGLVPEPVHSVHRIFDPRLAAALARQVELERREAAREIEILTERSKLRS